MNVGELRLRTAALAAKSSSVTQPSEANTFLSAVPGYLDKTRQIGLLQHEIGPILGRNPITSQDVRLVLRKMASFNDDDLLSRLSKDARAADTWATEESLHQSMLLARALLAAQFIGYVGLLLWLVTLLRSRHRYEQLAIDRQLALHAAEEASNDKRRFLSMVNHEVRSPLQSIVTAAELLSIHETEPKRMAAVRRIQYAVVALQGQLRDLLTIARADGPLFSLHEETFDFLELMSDVCNPLAEAAHSKDLSFRLDLPADQLVVTGDPIRIAQVIRNLVENAIRNTSSGRIDVTVEAGDRGSAEFQIEKTGIFPVSVVIADTGPGLPADALDKLLGPLAPFETGPGGTGIGLHVVRDVLDQLKGQVSVSATGSSGTTLVVSLHLMLADVATAEPLTQPPYGVLNVAVIDDQAELLERMVNLIRGLGHSCVAFGSIADAQQALNEVAFDAVLIALQSSDTNGAALASEIRQGGGPSAAAMFIFVGATEDRASGQTWSFDGFLQTPVTANSLAGLIGSKTHS